MSFGHHIFFLRLWAGDSRHVERGGETSLALNAISCSQFCETLPLLISSLILIALGCRNLKRELKSKRNVGTVLEKKKRGLVFKYTFVIKNFQN